MSKLLLTSGAKRDLAEIKRYITGQLQNGPTALRVVASITKELHSLKRFPQLGRTVNLEMCPSGYRVLVCGNYLAFYRVEDGTVLVDRVLYGRRDYMTLLFGEESNPEGTPPHH